jgi:AraC family transcriptional activator of mtrCDE
MHDGGGAPPAPARERQTLNLTISENAGGGERLDLLCGRFVLAAPHERLLRDHLPGRLVVSAGGRGEAASTGAQLAGLVNLLRMESSDDRLGGHVMLGALSTALFALALRLASETAQAPGGLLALAAAPRLAPALAAMFNEPGRPWSLPELARLCHMSRATLARRFQETLGRSASELLTDIRMTLAAEALRTSSASTAAVGESVGYQSEAAFQRAFKQHLGVTPSRWRRAARASDPDSAATTSEVEKP